MKRNRYSSVEGFLDRRVGMEPIVIDLTKEEAKMAKIFRNIHLYCRYFYF